MNVGYFVDGEVTAPCVLEADAWGRWRMLMAYDDAMELQRERRLRRRVLSEYGWIAPELPDPDDENE